MTGKIFVEGVPAADIRHVWPRCWPLLERALARVPDGVAKHNEKSLRLACEEKRAQLWVAWDHEAQKFIGAAISELTEPDAYPDATCCEVPLLAGERFPKWGFRFFEIIKAWALAQGCSHLVGYGRSGWVRLFKFRRFGHAPDGVAIFTLGLKDN